MHSDPRYQAMGGARPPSSCGHRRLGHLGPGRRAYLGRLADITLSEAGAYFGGHTHTVDVALPDAQGHPIRFGVDTGFLVLNERTYPSLLALLVALEMSQRGRATMTQQIADGTQAFLVWEFRFRFQRFDTATVQRIRGGSHLTLDNGGRISEHRDYWDAAEELYEKLPGLGTLMRWLERQASK